LRFLRTALVLLVPVFAGPAACEELVDRIVAVVGETPLLESQLQEQLEVLRGDPSVQRLSEEEARELALQKLVEDEILLAKAGEEGLAPTSEEVEEALEGTLERMRTQFPTEEAFQKALEREGVTLEELRRRYRAEVEKTLTIRALVERDVRWKTDVTEGEARRFFEERREELPVLPERYSLAQIFIEPGLDESAEAAASETLEALRSRISSGEDFAEVARKESDGPSAPRGGDLGYFGRGEMDPAFEEAAFALAEPGDMSDPVRTRFGFHLIQLVDRDGERIRVRHILKTIPAGEKGWAAARDQAHALWDSLQAGADFARLAETYSDDVSSAVKGGAIGVFALPDVSPEVQSALDGLRAGDISGVVEVANGLHIFRVLAHYEQGKPSFEDAREEVLVAVRQAKQQKAYQEYIDTLRDEIYVQVP
jgi:peptidyl-prolyl cis-trans isomerase SurA